MAKQRRESVRIETVKLNNTSRKGDYYRAQLKGNTYYYKKGTITKSEMKAYLEKKYIKQENVSLFRPKGKKANIIYRKDYGTTESNPKGISRIYTKKLKNKKTKERFTIIADVDYHTNGSIKVRGTISVSSGSVGSFDEKRAELKRNAYGAVASREGVASGEVIIERIYNMHYSFITTRNRVSQVQREIFG